jgi:hypothetical protein
VEGSDFSLESEEIAELKSYRENLKIKKKSSRERLDTDYSSLSSYVPSFSIV